MAALFAILVGLLAGFHAQPVSHYHQVPIVQPADATPGMPGD